MIQGLTVTHHAWIVRLVWSTVWFLPLILCPRVEDATRCCCRPSHRGWTVSCSLVYPVSCHVNRLSEKRELTSPSLFCILKNEVSENKDSVGRFVKGYDDVNCCRSYFKFSSNDFRGVQWIVTKPKSGKITQDAVSYNAPGNHTTAGFRNDSPNSENSENSAKVN